ncbi:fructose PTS transporter subunit IIA [Clostridium sp. OS1-26]|uniref:PTS sugar transporter subunit IIA n=1 Tax=Clostridium sp. OS1-26 TaxID=3070681 RepID=UPI0027E11186|nr:fructose PTS transporter subunit IIA [Clostridium sp. OS1-26]WML32945.1 fructose PTS transporter subunit IIA [Clostridium sp. OS1-26]
MVKDIFNREHIKLNVDFDHKDKLLKYIADLSTELGISKDSEGVYSGLLEREKEFETGLGDKIAIPHTKSDVVINPAVLVLKTVKDIEWGKECGGVNLIITFLTPKEQAGTTHIKLLSSLSRKLIDEDFKNKLLTSNDQEEIFQLVESAFKNI